MESCSECINGEAVSIKKEMYSIDPIVLLGLTRKRYSSPPEAAVSQE